MTGTTRPTSQEQAPEAGGDAGVGELSAAEQEVLDRVAPGALGWAPVGRDADGSLILATCVPAGRSNPGKLRRVVLTLRPEGHCYRTELVSAA